MPNYDRQAVVEADPDNTITSGSQSIAAKCVLKGIPTTCVEFPVAGHPDFHRKMGQLSDALRPLTKDSRLYIRGHGSWISQTVGGVEAKAFARTLLNAGLYKTKLISICACQAGRDKGASDFWRLTNSADSFASQFHQALKDLGNLESVVYARVYNVRVAQTGGEKATAHQAKNIAPENSREKSKLRFSWEGGTQKREWVSYSLSAVAGELMTRPVYASLPANSSKDDDDIF